VNLGIVIHTGIKTANGGTYVQIVAENTREVDNQIKDNLRRYYAKRKAGHC